MIAGNRPVKTVYMYYIKQFLFVKKIKQKYRFVTAARL